MTDHAGTPVEGIDLPVGGPIATPVARATRVPQKALPPVDYRNPVRNGDVIDCEINHPVYGWVPFTASPEDPEQHGRDLFALMDKELSQ